MENIKFNKLNLTQNLVNGIEERNNENYQNAIDLFEYCKSIDATDLRIYENMYKVEFFRKDYDLAFRNLMIILHNQILVDSVRNHPIGEVVFNQELKSFTTQNKQLFDNYLFEPELILKAICENKLLQNIIFVGNSVTYRIGHAYVGKYLNTNILNEFENKDELFENYNFRITDRERGASFFTQNYKGYFVCIGFIYAHMNLNFNLKNIHEIIHYYLGSEFEIKSNIWDYNKIFNSSAKMTSSQEMVMTLFTDETINKVKEQFKNNEELIPNESFDMSFRLFMSNVNSINLELLMQMTVDSEEIQDIPEIGQGVLQKSVMFYKPIGYYTQRKSLLSYEIEVTVVKEFENELDALINSGKIPPSIKIHKLTLEENAVLAAFSLEALLKAQKYEDSTFFANGLHCDIFMTFDNEYPQVFLDDIYGVSGPIAAYLLRDQNSIFPILEYEELYKKFHSMNLLTAYKRF